MTRIVSYQKKKRNHPERDEQIKFVTWLRKQGFRCHHSPNGGSRHLLEAMQLKRMGTSAGFPDVFVPLPTPKYHSFFVEMKPIKGGTLNENQVDWLSYLREKGFFAEEAHGFEEAKSLFLQYLATFPEAA